jgi:tripartite-type tricarboxylate transporter receptor subunit TctC
MNPTGNARRQLMLGALAACAPGAWAQTPTKYPERPIRLVVGFAPGGPNDVMARVLAQRLGQDLGQPVVVENKSGAGGVIGSDAVAKAPPDGYTLLFVSAPFVMAPAIQARMPFDTLKDFAPVTKVAESPMVLMVPSNSRFKSVQDLIAYARANPGKVNYGSGGPGSTPHLTTEMLSVVTGARFTHIPYKGGGESIKALMAGEIDFLIDSITSTAGPLQSGRIKPLAVSSGKRSAKLPNVPTFEESGVQKFEMTHWVGLVAPSAVPASILSQLRAESVRAIHSPDVEQKLNELGAQPVGDSAQVFGEFIKTELARWKSVAKAANITAQ